MSSCLFVQILQAPSPSWKDESRTIWTLPKKPFALEEKLQHFPCTKDRRTYAKETFSISMYVFTFYKRDFWTAFVYISKYYIWINKETNPATKPHVFLFYNIPSYVIFHSMIIIIIQYFACIKIVFYFSYTGLIKKIVVGDLYNACLNSKKKRTRFAKILLVFDTT